MGCGSSKVDDLPLVALCRERKDLIREAADQRYALAAAHVSYFRASRSIGEALRRFVEEEIVVGPAPSSPVITIPSSEGKSKTPSSSTSLSHKSISQESHLHLSDESDSDTSLDHDSVLHSEHNFSPRPPSSSSPPPQMQTTDYYYNYVRSSSSAIPSVVYEHPSPYYFGVPMEPVDSRMANPPAAPSTPPPPPEVSTWDFLNPFGSFDNEYGYGYRYGYNTYGTGEGSDISSPDSSKVREREGIPDLEDETETEQVNEFTQPKNTEPQKPKKSDKLPENGKLKKSQNDNLYGEGSSSRTRQAGNVDVKTSSEENALKGVEEDADEEVEEVDRKKGVSFEVETSAGESIESLQTSSKITLSSVQSRDIREVVEEIKDLFVVASDCGKEVAMMLEVGRVRYRPRNPILKVMCCRILDVAFPPVLPFVHPSRSSKMGKTRHGNFKSPISMKSGSLSSTLEKLYMWEKKLYKEVKDEEKLRIIYDKQCKRLKSLDDRGAETYKIDATQASIKKLLTKLSVAIRAIDSIAVRIHKLRDEELKPQLIELFQGFMGMWKDIMKCHRKQFQAILESKTSSLIGKTQIRSDSSTRATIELEQELLNWCACFDQWIRKQRAYIKALNGWLINCLDQKPEITPDGVVPFSPGRIGAPPVFVISNDWCSVMDRILEADVTQAMQNFASSVHKLWERQDEERRQKLRAEFLTRDFEKRLRSLEVSKDAIDKKVVSASNRGSGVLQLDLLKRRLDEERAKHVEIIKQVQEAVAGSIEMGLVPIFEAMDKFSSIMVEDIERVRIQEEGR
ncbi:protein ALTERED PHOSPHATE STARVATION RESPONSE 1-like [Aristolochia californica]|uniref:protein ALTERED PHOSPHATE STARVATION RESPONSE 1-like n=1 Tax=Aristolochia californica TaxID=171875 RepID=UPI0035DA79BA